MQTMTTTTFEKTIRYDHGDYKMELDGRLIGYARTYHEAEVTLDQVAHEMLIHGDCATATELDGDQVEAASWSTAPVASVDDTPTDAPGDDCPDHGPYGDDECPKCSAGYAPAATLALQSLLDLQARGVCLNCEGAHRTWQCPEIVSSLFAVYDTRELAGLWATSRTLLAAKLSRLTRAQLHTQAVAFAAWLNAQTRAGLSAASVLHIWETFILAGGDPALKRAA